MPRDYKHRATTRRRKRRPVSPWLGLAAGLLIGVFAAAIAYFKVVAPAQQVAAPPFAADTPPPEAAPAAPVKETKQAVKAPEPPAPTKPRFDFYTILPEMEVVIPEDELAGKAPPSAFKPEQKPASTAVESEPDVAVPAKPATAAVVAPQSPPQPEARPAPSSGGNYFLLSGTFSTADQADRLKAQLTLLGLNASVQKLTVNKQNTIHRVRVGPFRDYASLNEARAVLRQHGIQGTPVMIRK
jgi:cell division protein FtsN